MYHRHVPISSKKECEAPMLALTKARVLVAFGLVALVVGACGGSAASGQSGETGKVVFVGNGGSTQDAQDTAFTKPFADQFHVQVTEGTDSSLARVKAAVLSGHPDFDVTSVNQADYIAGVQAGLWEPIDYSYFRPEDLKSMPADVRKQYGVGDIYYSQNLIFNNKLFPATGAQPTSWSDFWDLSKFPGKRGVPSCKQAARTMLPEAALLADGVPVSQLYPLDINRALNKIKQLGKSAVWYDQVDTALTLLSSGDESMAIGPNGRVQILVDKKAPIQLVWNQARVSFDMLVIIKGSPNKVDAQKLVAFMSQPQPQAKMAALSGYGPSNPAAYNSIDASVMAHLVTNPAIVSQTFVKNDQWWIDNTQKWLDACSATLGV
jgi:putative spermidine/putrescine transport system substrate-binding protein